MAQVGSNVLDLFNETQSVLPSDEFGVMVCLMGLPLIWTVLIGGMLSGCVETFRIMLALAIIGGVAACVARLVWLCRQDPG